MDAIPVLMGVDFLSVVDMNIETYFSISSLVYCIGLIFWMHNKRTQKTKLPIKEYLIQNVIASLLWPITIPMSIYMGFAKK